MSEPEKRGSKWPWILVPVGAVSLFFLLKYCQSHLPPAPERAEPVAEKAKEAESKASPDQPATP